MNEVGAVVSGDFGRRRDVFQASLVDRSENNCLFLLGSDDFYDLRFDAPESYDSDFSCAVVNVDLRRCKRIVLGDAVQYRLWPRQFVRILRCGDIWLADPPSQRWKLPSSRTIFVAPDGDDFANDGMLPVSPLRTPQLAADLIVDQFDINGTDADVRLLDGVYDVAAGSQLINLSRPLHGKNKFTVSGNVDDPDRVVINIPAQSYGFYVEDFGILVIFGMRLVTNGLGSTGLFVRQFGIGDLGWVHFGNFEQSNPVTTWNGSVNVIGPIRFDGNAHFMFSANRGGEIDLGTPNIEIAEGLSVKRLLHADRGGRIYAQSATWSSIDGGAPPVLTGQKAFADGQGSQIYANAAAMPGTIAEATINAGQFFQIPRQPGIDAATALEAINAQKDALLAQKNTLLEQQQALLAERDATLAEQKQLLAQRDESLVEQKQLLAERDATLAEQKQLLAQRDATLAEQKSLIADKDDALHLRDVQFVQQQSLLAERDTALQIRETQLAQHKATIHAIKASTSWRITAPLRKIGSWLRR